MERCGGPRAAPESTRVVNKTLIGPVWGSVITYQDRESPFMLHHISFGVRELQLSGAFYDAALGALGFRRVFEDETAIGYGWVDGQDKFSIKSRSGATAPSAGFHLAFAAPSRRAVDEFHMAALKIGGRDNGAPGLRLHYGPHYYAAFLIDPDGYHIECVCKAPES